MTSKVLYLIFGLLIVVGLVYFFSLGRQTQPVNLTASSIPLPTSEVFKAGEAFSERNAFFLIFTNGFKRDFSDTKYHNKDTEVFIESNNPSLIRVTSQVTWQQFFDSLPMSLKEDCLITGTMQTFCTGSSGELKFYINDVEDPNALDFEINNGDRLLVTFGKGFDVKTQLEQLNSLK